MKTIIRNGALTIMATISLFFSNPALAFTKDSSNNGSRVELKVIGTFNDRSVFQLKVSDNLTKDIFSISIRDSYGNTIYQELVRKGDFSKKFLFDNEEINDETLEMEVYNRTTKQSIIYEIKRSYATTEDVVINQLK